MSEETLPLDRLMGQLAEAIRHKENHEFIRPFLETGLSIIDKKASEEYFERIN